ncbi:hypothetical protein [Calidifontibacter indicus]|uniref:hypothetical protein n=1 Tax=Calidifontibacter indicus TaxID=419650 RepID=UPI003D74798F
MTEFVRLPEPRPGGRGVVGHTQLPSPNTTWQAFAVMPTRAVVPATSTSPGICGTSARPSPASTAPGGMRSLEAMLGLPAAPSY